MRLWDDEDGRALLADLAWAEIEDLRAAEAEALLRAAEEADKAGQPHPERCRCADCRADDVDDCPGFRVWE